MKQFILIAYDAKDDGAYARRMTTRQAHIDAITQARKEGKVICGIAITDAQDKMIGSVVITHFSSRAEFDTWLAAEPYIVNNVWQDVTVLNGSLGPSFADLIQH